MGEFGRNLTIFITGLFALAIVAMILSNRSKTTDVIQAFSSGLGNLLGVVMSPVTGSNSGSAASTSFGSTGPQLGSFADIFGRR